jgi:transposase
MALQRRYPEELRRRAVRLVLDARDEAGGRRGVCTRVGQQLGVPPDTLRGWVYRAEINEGARPGTTTDEHARLVGLEREVRELRRANAIVKAALVFFAAELDRPLNR